MESGGKPFNANTGQSHGSWESSHLYRVMFAVAGTAMAALDDDTTILITNRRMEQLLGRPREEIEGKLKLTQFIHHKDLDRVIYYYRQQREKEGAPVQTYTVAIVNSQGDVKNVYIKIGLIPASKMSVVAISDMPDTSLLERKLRESEENFRLLFDNAQEGIFRSNPAGKILLANSAFVRMLGYASLEEVQQLDIARDLFVNPEQRRAILAMVNAQETVNNVEVTWKKKDGTHVIMRGSGRAIRDESGDVVCYENTMVDISSLKEAQRKLEESRQFFLNIINCLPDPTFAVNTQGEVMAWNKAMAHLTGITEEKILGCGSYEYAVPFYGERRPVLIDYVLHPALREAETSVKIRQDGETLMAEVFAPLLRNGVGAHLWCSAALIRDIDGSIVGAISTVKDFTEYKETQQKLRFYSMYDVLTGLYNRSYFEEEIIHLDQNSSSPISVIMCDVDGLKLINDSLGHHIGDELLKAAANVIRSVFRINDIVSRIGGDEFAILLPETDEKAAAEAVTRLWLALKEYNSSSPEIPLSLSIGYATGNIPVQSVIIEADNNLNRNKLRRSNSAKSHFTTTLMAMLAERDYVTEGHADRMEELAEVMAKAAGLSPSEKIDLILLAKFHDIGKVGISDKLLFKPAPLTEDEMDEMKRHSEIGYRIALSSPDLSHIAKYILHHHEWWNGQGYPLGLAEEKIPLPCRILTLIDTYDAMTSDRPYRNALTHEDVVEYIQSQRGIRFDPELLDIFVTAVQDYNCAKQQSQKDSA